MGTNLLKSEGVGMAVWNKEEKVKSQNKWWGRWRTQGGKPGTCSVMKGKYTKSFYGGVVSVGSGRALTKETLPLGQVSPAASREVRNGEGNGSMTQR